ncbi:TetR/AcrR family fatty acid metabolism transcriptional regulator [Scopulibacillus daqui]|uniref:TetR/AcrR family fatty acid metabolism transcriptional regulator n=1 Tax=Scopulibacillus daqui TaxID=1469162 RepID=A0ABS2PYY1_9BACL|nr:TetR/AcrR family transcriptional regulator [Scopulibacillus daqui]MBM7644760.1 TetR/AcrR family fatty acid metabolism transcriptional regulator [Scopulibacillus daqui]
MSIEQRPKYKQIIDAAVSVIAENGFHRSQVSKIAKRAGVADGTIYIYFKNKEDILVSLFREKMGQFVEKIEAEIKGKNDAKEKLLTMVKVHFNQLAADYPLAIVTQLELRQSEPGIRMEINNIFKNYLRVIDEILIEGKQQKIFRDNIDTRLARQMIFGTLDDIVTNWVMNDQKYDLQALAEPVGELLVNGLCC